MDKTHIQWTSATWNPLRGCSRVSEGCRNCYAEIISARFSGKGLPYEDLAESTPSGPRWTGEVRFVEKALPLPLRWKTPRRIFVNSMSDLFHEKVSDDWIAQIFAVMLMAPRHTFQVLTKRPERMTALLNKPGFEPHVESQAYALSRKNAPDLLTYESIQKVGIRWPLPNVWLGVSVEDQATYKQRVLYLANTPAAVRFVSMEPLLADLGDLMLDGIYGDAYQWAIVGGESGPGARPFDVRWWRSAVKQCRAAGVPIFCKQAGSMFVTSYYDDEYRMLYDDAGLDWPGPIDWDITYGQPPLTSRVRIKLRDRKGGDWNEWPEDLRIREYPIRKA